MKLVGLTQNVTIEDMMDFLMCPTDMKRHAPSKRKSKTPAKRKRSSSKGDDVKNGAEKKGKKTKETKTKKTNLKETKKSKTPKKVAAVVQKKKRDTDDEIDSSLSDSEGEEEKTVHPPKKRKLSESVTDISRDDSFTGPSDEDIVTVIRKTVEGIDLEEVSMKQAVSKVNEAFPDDDLSDKKSFIKEKIRELIG